MPTNTYVALKTTTLSADAASVNLDLSSITGYTDLVIVANYKLQHDNYALGFRVGNGSVDTNTNYSWTRLLGYSGGPFSGRNTGMTLGVGTTGGNSSANVTIFNLQNYSNTTCLLYTSPSPRDRTRSRMPSSA